MSFEYAVEFDHDENLLRSQGNVSYLSEFLSLLTLKSSQEESQEFQDMHGKLVQLKREAEVLDANFESPSYYEKKEQLIFKVVCEIKGIDHQQWLNNEKGLGHYSEGEFVQNGN